MGHVRGTTPTRLGLPSATPIPGPIPGFSSNKSRSKWPGAAAHLGDDRRVVWQRLRGEAHIGRAVPAQVAAVDLAVATVLASVLTAVGASWRIDFSDLYIWVGFFSVGLFAIL